MFLRVGLFLLTNFAVIAVFSVTSRLLGLDHFLAAQGMQGQMTSLLLFAAIAGFAGSFISLAMSKMMAKRSMGVEIIEQPRNATEKWLVDTVARQAQQAGIGMPEVGIFHSPEPNAFATGMKKNDALVAVSTGLLERMDRGAVEAVLGHEVGHVANGDMVTMGLIQGVLNTFVIFFARIIGMAVDSFLNKNNEGESSGPGIGYFVVSIIAEIILGIFASMIAAWFSRRREFRADEAGATLSSRENMISALQALQRVHEPEGLPSQMAAFGINGGAGMLQKLMSSHPPLEDRIATLQQSR